jgi:predicted RNase H-like nuclease
VPKTGSTKPIEDKIDAVLCAYIGARWWLWAAQRNKLYGDGESGYIVVPQTRAYFAFAS